MEKNLLTPKKPTRTRKLILTGDPFSQTVALLLALMAFLSLLISSWNDEAANQAANAARESQRFQVMADTLTKTGEIETSAYMEVYRQWLIMNTMGNTSFQASDEAAAQRYWWINDKILSKITPLLAPPYFEFYQQTAGKSFSPPKFSTFESDTYLREAASYSEFATNNNQISNTWADKTSSYANITTLFAIALFLLGTSAGLTRWARWSFSFSGVALTLLSLVWAISIKNTPVSGMPPTAMTYYSYGIGWAHQGEYDKAIRSFSQSLELTPNYSNALFQRGLANRMMGKMDAALTDFNTLVASGQTDETLFSEMAWAYYFNGDMEKSASTWQKVLDSQNTANRITAQFNLGLSRIANGNVEPAKEAYQKGIQLASTLVQQAHKDGKELSGSEWWAIDQAATHLDFLLTCWKEQHCEGTPPYQKISSASNAVKDTAKATSKQLKETMVALEFFGDLPKEETLKSNIEPLFFFAQSQGADGKPVQGPRGVTFADAEKTIMTTFNYTGMEANRQVLLKIYVNGVESPSLRNIQKWPAGAVVGVAELPINTGGLRFETGFYWVELYVDSHLVQEGGFEIQPAKGFNSDYNNASEEDIKKRLEEIPPNPHSTK